MLRMLIQVPCTPPPPSPTPPHACAPRASNGTFIPWVRAVNASNVYGEVANKQSRPGFPFFGMFNSEDGCRAACELYQNCTQYLWAGYIENNTIYSPWNKQCFGRCDDVWTLHPVAHGGVSTVSARRIVPHAGGWPRHRIK